MANIFTRVLDRVTPWNRKGEVQRGQERKKKKEDEERIVRQRAPQARRPQNVFEQDVQEVLKDKSLNTVVSVPRGGPEVTDYDRPIVDTTPKIAAGTGVLTPEAYAAKNNQMLQQNAAEIEKRIPKPQQSLVNKFRDVVDANTEADQYRRAVAGAKSETARLQEQGMDREKAMTRGVRTARIMSKSPARSGADDVKDFGTSFVRGAATVPSALGRIVTGIGEGVTDLAGFAGTAINSPINLIRNGTLRGASDNAVANFMKTVKRRGITPSSEFLDRSAKTIGGEQNMPAYRAAQTAGEVVGAVATLGASAAKYAPKTAQVFKLGEAAETSRLAPIIKFVDNLVNSPIKGLGELLGRGRNVAPEVNVVEDLLTKGQLDDIATTNIPVRESVPIVSDGVEEAVNVRNVPRTDPLIREIGGDAQKVNQAATGVKKVQNATPNTVDVPRGRPDPRIEGLTPNNTGNTGLTTKAEIDAERKALDEALLNKELNKTQHKAANKELDNLTAADDVPTKGTPIQVKQVNSIPVDDANINVPTNLPETPGSVRVTTQSSPNNAKTAAVAETQQVYTDASKSDIPVVKDTANQYILDNPKKFTKTQVASARNQRKLARQMAKTQEDTAQALGRIEASKVPQGTKQSDDFAPTGEFAIGKKGDAYEVSKNKAEADLGKREMADRSAEDLAAEVVGKKSVSGGDMRKITAAKENLKNADPENFRNNEVWKLLDKAERSSKRTAAKILAMIPRTIRKSANSEALTGRWENKIVNALDDPSKLTNDQWKMVQNANDEFTAARDKAGKLEEQFRKTGSEADFKAWEKAHEAARNADTNAKMTEVKVAKDVLKGEKGPAVTDTIDKLKKEADVNTMDLVSANMLSGTGTGVRNTVGTELMGIENRLFANTRAKITNKLFKQNVGGYNRMGAKYGRKVGVKKLFGDAKRRADIGGKNPLEWAKNWSTTINSGGETSLQSQVYSRLGKYYQNQFKQAGVTGKALDLKMRHAMIADPDDMADIYLDAAMKSSGLTGMFEKGQTIEKAVTDWVGRGTDSKIAQGASKLVMRMLVGFPTATGNFLAQSGKRVTLGLPSFIEMGAKLAKSDKAGAAMAFERGLKEAGSGAAVMGLGVGLGKAGVITGPYPSDKDERERWATKGKTENSIKIGGAWYPIPQGAGMLGLPLMMGAAIGAEGDSNESVKNLFNPKSLAKLLPTDQIQGVLNTLTGDESPQALKNLVAGTVRAATPVGALLNQVAKSFDPTKNDTTTKDFWSNVLDQVYSGIPGVNNAADIPDKTDSEGNPISNPNPLELALGAASDVQGGGEQRVQEMDSKINSELSNIDKYGLLSDENLDGVLEGSGLEAYNKAKSGKQLDESDIKSLKEGLVKGVSSEGTDTAYLEREQYDTNLAVLKLKKELMESDKTVRPSSLKDIDTAIKRGEVYKQNKVPYDLISEYKSVGVDEWRNLGDPEDDNYDPDRYQQLWAIDEMMTKAGVSYKKGALDKPKYSAKKSKGGGRGGRGGSGGGSKKVDSDIGGQLKDGSYAPRVREYASIDAKSGSVPVIRRVRPNIVHKISSSG